MKMDKEFVSIEDCKEVAPPVGIEPTTNNCLALNLTIER